MNNGAEGVPAAPRDRNPTLRLDDSNVPGAYFMRGTREGYAALARQLTEVARSAPGEFVVHGPRWKQLATDFESAFAWGTRCGSIFGCELVDEVRDDPVDPSRSVMRFKHRLGLFGCVAGGLLVFGVLLRGLFALWSDLS